jgi:hypothetical protein
MARSRRRHDHWDYLASRGTAHRYLRPAGLGLGAMLAISGAAPAFAQTSLPTNMQGAWLEPSASCEEVFARTKQGVVFRKPVNAFAPAIIVSGRRVVTPLASCQIKSVKPLVDRHLLILSCATSVAADEVRAILGMSEDGSLRRFLNDDDKIGTNYSRCRP